MFDATQNLKKMFTWNRISKQNKSAFQLYNLYQKKSRKLNFLQSWIKKCSLDLGK